MQIGPIELKEWIAKYFASRNEAARWLGITRYFLDKYAAGSPMPEKLSNLIVPLD